MGLMFEAIAVKGHIGYASDYKRNGLFKVDLNSNTCDFVCSFESEPVFKQRIHSYAVWGGDCACFIPNSGEHIDIYNVITGTMQSLQIPLQSRDLYGFYNPEFKFVDGEIFDEYLWLYPATYPGVLGVDLNTLEMRLIQTWVPEKGFFNRKAVCKSSTKTYFASGNSNAVFIFDKHRQEVSVREIGGLNRGMMSACIKGEVIWMSPRLKGPIISWDINTDRITEYGSYPDDFEYKRVITSKIFETGESICISPYDANEGLIITDGRLIADREIAWKLKSDSLLGFLFEAEGKLYFAEVFSDDKNRIFKIDKESKRINDCVFEIVNEEYRQETLLREAIKNNELMTEDKEFGLSEFIGAVKR